MKTRINSKNSAFKNIYRIQNIQCFELYCIAFTGFCHCLSNVLYPYSINQQRYIRQSGRCNYIPKRNYFQRIQNCFQNSDIWRSYINTLLYTTVGTFINILLSSMCAYPLSRKDFYGRSVFTFIVAFTMFMSGGMIPLYLTVLKLRLIDTMWAIVLPPAISTYNMIIMRTFSRVFQFLYRNQLFQMELMICRLYGKSFYHFQNL